MTQQQKDELFNLLMKFRRYEQTAGEPNEEYQQAYEAIENFVDSVAEYWKQRLELAEDTDQKMGREGEIKP